MLLFMGSSNLLLKPSGVFFTSVTTYVWYFFNFFYIFVEVLTVLVHSSSQFGEHLYYHQASLTGRLLISILFSSISKVLS